MSGLFVSSQLHQRDNLTSIAQDLTWKKESWRREFRLPNYCATISRFDRDHLWAPARDHKSDTTVILIGRIALTDQEWRKAELLPYEGGVACKYILGRFLSQGEKCTSEINGAFGIVILREGDPKLTVITDRGGFCPLYASKESGEIAICSHTDVLAKWSLQSVEYDFVTMAELLARRPEHPHTYYVGIKQLDPGCIYRFEKPGGLEQSRYWSAEVTINRGVRSDETSLQLADALKSAVGKRTISLLGKSGLFLSAGADSRAVLYASTDPGEIISFTLFDEENEELRIAREIAGRTGSRHVALQRKFEHYTDSAERSVRITGGMGRIYDAHYTGSLESLWESGAENFLSGCYADVLFKSALIVSRYKTFLGRALPIKELSTSTINVSRIHHGISDKWKKPIIDRIYDCFRDCDLSDTSDEGLTRIGLARAFPISRVVPGSLLLMFRALPWDPVMADTELLDLSRSIPASLKVNSQVWEHAVRYLRPDLADIPNNNNRVRLGASNTEIFLNFFFSVAYRKVFRKDFGGTPLGGFATRGSWPDFGYLLQHSEVIPIIWAKKSDSADILADLLGFDPWSLSLVEWAAKDTEQFYRLLTLKLWLDYR